MKIRLCVLAVVFIFTSCKNNRENNNNRIWEIIEDAEMLKKDVPTGLSIVQIHYDEIKEMPYSELGNKIHHIKYVPLYSSEPIGVIDQIAIHKDRIVVLDAFKSERVYIYNLSGSLVNIIHRKGAGPEEYIGLADMSISNLTDEIVLNDRLALHTLFFSLNGDFIRKTKSPPNFFFEMQDIYCINQLTFGQSYSDDVNFHLVISLGDSIVKKGFLFYPLQNNAVNSKSLFYNYKKELLFSPTLSDTVYQIMDGASYSAKYVIKQNQSVWNKKHENISNEEYRNLVKHSGYTYLGKPILECSNYLYYPICFGKNGYIQTKPCWYDKKNKKSFFIGNRENDSECIYGYLPMPLAIYNDCFAGIITVDEIDQLKAFVNYGDNVKLLQDKNLKSILKSNRDDLEAILVIYSFK